jgi:hypothetical protein
MRLSRLAMLSGGIDRRMTGAFIRARYDPR